MRFLVFDLGTSGGKAAVVDESGKVLSLKKETWAAQPSPGLETFAREFDPAEVEGKLVSCARSAMKGSQTGPDQVAALACTALRFGYVFLDGNGEVVYFGSNMDGRGFFEQGNFVEAAGDRTQEVTGLYPPMLFCIPKLLWFKENAPASYQRISKIMNLNDWWVYRLSGVYATDPSSASTTGLLDLRKAQWSSELLGDFGLSQDLLPELKESGSLAGPLKEEFKRTFDISKADVAVSGPDTQCGLLGAGCASDGDMGVVAGATVPVMKVVDGLPQSLDRKVLAGAYPVQGKFVLEANAGPCGLLYDWAVGMYTKSDNDPYGAADRMISSSAGPTGMVSLLGSQIMTLEKMHVLKPAVTVFPSPVMPGAAMGDPTTFLNAVVEELCYAISCNVDVIDKFQGKESGALNVTGGMTRSRKFLRVLSDASGREVRPTVDPNATLVGVALCAMAGSGMHGSVEEAMRHTSLLGEPVVPDDQAWAYKEAKSKWRDLYTKIFELTEEGAF